MRILFGPLAGAYGIGGITRCLAVAEHALIRGHQVAFLTPPDYPLLDEYALGARFPTARPVHPPGQDGNYATFAEALDVRGMADPRYLDAAVTAEIAAIEAFRPDILFTEWQATLAVSGHATGVPMVATIATPDVTRMLGGGPEDSAFAHVHEAYAELCDRYAVPPAECVESLLHERAVFNVAPTVPALEPLLVRLPRVLFSGPLLFAPTELKDAAIAPAPATASLVLTYLGTGTISIPDLLPSLVDAFPAPEYEIVVATSRHQVGDRAVPYREGNVHVLRAPGMSRALARADLMISRGGQNSLMAAMLAGVPVIGLPGEHVEPRFNLGVIEAHGAARVLNGTPTASELKEAAAELVRMRAAERAAAIGDLLREPAGVGAVVQAMERTALTGAA